MFVWKLVWEMAEKEYITIAAVEVLILVCVEVSVGAMGIKPYVPVSPTVLILVCVEVSVGAFII